MVRVPGARTARHRAILAIGLGTLLLVTGLAEAVSLQVGSAPEEATAVSSGSQFLAHWVFVGAATAATPAAFPRAWSTIAAFPTRLSRIAGPAMVNPGRAGDVGASWTFNESAGIPLSTELDLQFTVHYQIGPVVHTFVRTVYVETQRRAFGGTIGFTAYWDSGGTAALSIQSMLEISQVCSAVGACP